MYPPATTTFDPINRRSSLPQSHSALGSSSVSQASDLAHMASIVQGLVAMVQPSSRPVPSTPENKPAHTTSKSAPPSPLRNTPSKLSRFLKYAEQHLGVQNATGYEDNFRAHGYGPDILHLVEDTALQRIGLSEGDIIRLKQNALRWWNLESESNKRKRPDEDTGGSMPPPHRTPCTPPNIKVRFEQRFHDGGSARLYGPRISPGQPPLDMDFDWTYFCEARGRYVPLPDGYVPVLDVPIIP
jgi:hypothetical protein